MTDAKVCLNCTFFDRGAHHECRESSAEWVRDKELGNFCGYFQGISARDASGTESLSQMQQLDSLFKQDATEPSAKKITSLDDLFKK